MRRTVVIIGNAMLISAAVCGALGTVITGFALPVDLVWLMTVMIVSSVAASIIIEFMRGKGILVILPMLLLMITLEFSRIIEGAKSVVYVITSEFSQWLFVPLLYADSRIAVEDISMFGADGRIAAGEITLFFTALGMVIALILSTAVCLRRSVLLMLLFTLPIALTSFVLVSTQPDMRYVIALLAAYITLLISGALHIGNPGWRGMEVFPALALTALILGAAGIVAPQGSRNDNELTRSIDMEIRLFLSRIGVISYDAGIGWAMENEGQWRFDTRRVGVANAGLRTISDVNLLEITVSEPGMFYLRGFSMDQFDGRSWLVSNHYVQNRDEVLARSMPTNIAKYHSAAFPGSGTVEAEMIIELTGDTTPDIMYIPYYYQIPFEQAPYYYQIPYVRSNPYITSFLYNAEISIAQMHSDLQTRQIEQALLGYSSWLHRNGQYMQIQASTAVRLRQIAIAAGIDVYASREAIAEQVADFVKSSARYTLRPLVIPEEQDFAVYFLETSKEGYCIHFATTAAMMLRALGIPARFTTGFAVTVPARNVGAVITLTDRHAHAWVEVYYDQLGWLPLEATPASAATGDSMFAPSTSYPMDNLPWEDPEAEYLDPSFDFPDVERPPADDDIAVNDIVQPGLSQRWGMLIVISSSVVMFVILFALRGLVSGRVRERRFNQDDANTAAICIRRYIVRLNRKKAIPEDIEDIALKARFSQHLITQDERLKMIEYSASLRSQTYQSKGIIGRLWLRCVRGL